MPSRLFITTLTMSTSFEANFLILTNHLDFLTFSCGCSSGKLANGDRVSALGGRFEVEVVEKSGGAV